MSADTDREIAKLVALRDQAEQLADIYEKANWKGHRERIANRISKMNAELARIARGEVKRK